MARLERLLGGNRDTLLGPITRIPSAVLGAGADYEIAILANPNIPTIPPVSPGITGFLPTNALYVRSVILVPEAAITGANTNTFYWQIRQWRAGVALNQYSLASVSAIAVGANTIVVTQAIAPNNPLQDVRVGDYIRISGGVGTAEVAQITALSIPNGTITFTAANTHSGAYTMACSGLSAITYITSVNEVALTPRQTGQIGQTALPAMLPNSLVGGDLLTLQRVTLGTGIASPAVDVQVDYGQVKGSTINPVFRG